MLYFFQFDSHLIVSLLQEVYLILQGINLPLQLDTT